MPTIIPTIGADPEFMLVSRRSKRPILAENFLDRYFTAGRITMSDQLTTSGTVFERSEIGEDGSGRPFEIRPKPDKDPLKVVENIHSILAEAVEVYPSMLGYDWKAGSAPQDWPLGGHIHFGTRIDNHRLVDDADCVHKLSSLLGCVVCLVEGRDEGIRRRRLYGFSGDVRTQEYGLEYRTPGSWLVSPYVASACLCLGHAIVVEMLNNKGFKPKRFNISTDKYGSEVCLINSTDTKALRKLFPDIWEAITKLSLYGEYKQYIDIFKFLIDNNLTWRPKIPMQAAWGLCSPLFKTTTATVDSIWGTAPQPA